MLISYSGDDNDLTGNDNKNSKYNSNMFIYDNKGKILAKELFAPIAEDEEIERKESRVATSSNIETVFQKLNHYFHC